MAKEGFFEKVVKNVTKGALFAGAGLGTASVPAAELPDYTKLPKDSNNAINWENNKKNDDVVVATPGVAALSPNGNVYEFNKEAILPPPDSIDRTPVGGDLSWNGYLYTCKEQKKIANGTVVTGVYGRNQVIPLPKIPHYDQNSISKQRSYAIGDTSLFGGKVTFNADGLALFYTYNSNGKCDVVALKSDMTGFKVGEWVYLTNCGNFIKPYGDHYYTQPEVKVTEKKEEVKEIPKSESKVTQEKKKLGPAFEEPCVAHHRINFGGPQGIDPNPNTPWFETHNGIYIEHSRYCQEHWFEKGGCSNGKSLEQVARALGQW